MLSSKATYPESVKVEKRLRPNAPPSTACDRPIGALAQQLTTVFCDVSAARRWTTKKKCLWA